MATTTTELNKVYSANVPKSSGDTGVTKSTAAPAVSNSDVSSPAVSTSNVQTQAPAAQTGAASTSDAAQQGTANTPDASQQGTAMGAVGNVINGAYDTSRVQAINDMYAEQQKALEEQYNAALQQQIGNAQAAADKIPGTYQTQANDLAVQYERNRRNLNQQAAGNGLNTGTGSQMALALGSEWQRDYGGLKQAQADAQAEAERQMVDIEAQIKSELASAIAQNNFQKAAALIDEYNNSQEFALKNAQILAQFGDFSMYEKLYGKEQADAMFNIWKAQNPDLAWQSGKMTAGEYEAITGNRPTGATDWSSTIDTVLENMQKNPYNGGGSGSSGGTSDYISAYNAAASRGESGQNAVKYFFGNGNVT